MEMNDAASVSDATNRPCFVINLDIMKNEASGMYIKVKSLAGKHTSTAEGSSKLLGREPSGSLSAANDDSQRKNFAAALHPVITACQSPSSAAFTEILRWRSAVDKQLASLHLYAHNVERDGKCLFRAASYVYMELRSTMRRFVHPPLVKFCNISPP
jgi:hypothetical protein